MEKGESFVQAVIREMKEETGMTVRRPRLCGLKQFQTDEDERYIVAPFKTEEFEGELVSSDEGQMYCIRREELEKQNLADDFFELLRVFDEEELTEFFYERGKGNEDWKVRLF